MNYFRGLLNSMPFNVALWLLIIWGCLSFDHCAHAAVPSPEPRPVPIIRPVPAPTYPAPRPIGHTAPTPTYPEPRPVGHAAIELRAAAHSYYIGLHARF